MKARDAVRMTAAKRYKQNRYPTVAWSFTNLQLVSRTRRLPLPLGPGGFPLADCIERSCTGIEDVVGGLSMEVPR